GFGLRVIPRAPCRVTHGPAREALDVHHDSAAGPRFARLIADGGGYRSKLDAATASLAEVLDVERGPIAGDWELETSSFRVAFPAGFTLCSVPAGSWSPFDLLGPEGSLVYVESPRSMPEPATMVGAGQRISSLGEGWVEVTYAHEGAAWWQRHQVVGRQVFTAQAPAGRAVELRATLTDVVKSYV